MAELFDQDKLEIVNTVVKTRYDLNYDQWFSQFSRKVAIMWFGLAFIPTVSNVLNRFMYYI